MRKRFRRSAFGHVLQTDFIGAGEAGPNGEDPVGSLTLSGFLNFTTQTTCLNISGNAVVSGGRILTGRDAGRGFLSSSIDHGPPAGGKPVDVTVFSGRLPRPPRNCPSPGDAPPEQLRHTGGGPFTSGDLIVVDAIERLAAGAPTARVRVLGLGLPSQVGLVTALQGPTVRIRVCGDHRTPLERAGRAGIRSGLVDLPGTFHPELRPQEPPCGVLGRPGSAATRAPCVLAWRPLDLAFPGERSRSAHQ
jgi:hypothetical protein